MVLVYNIIFSNIKHCFKHYSLIENLESTYIIFIVRCLTTSVDHNYYVCLKQYSITKYNQLWVFKSQQTQHTCIHNIIDQYIVHCTKTDNLGLVSRELQIKLFVILSVYVCFFILIYENVKLLKKFKKNIYEGVRPYVKLNMIDFFIIK